MLNRDAISSRSSLHLARRDGDRLVYAGTMETGFGDRDLVELRARLEPLVQARSPLAEPVKKGSKARWVRPELLVEIEYPNTSEDGRVRHPKFKGLREDLGRSL